MSFCSPFWFTFKLSHPPSRKRWRNLLGTRFFANFLEGSEGILIPFPFPTIKKERIRGKEVEDALYSKRPTVFNATTITSVVVVGTHLTFLALLPSLTRTPFRVASLNAPVNVYTCSSFHHHFHQQQTFSPCLCEPTNTINDIPLSKPFFFSWVFLWWKLSVYHK